MAQAVTKPLSSVHVHVYYDTSFLIEKSSRKLLRYVNIENLNLKMKNKFVSLPDFINDMAI